MRKVTAAVLALALVLQVQGPPAAAGPVELDPQNALKMAMVLLSTGQSENALAFADALLQRDPKSSRVLVIKSQAERNLGRYPEAAASARRAWAAAVTPAERFDAAMVMAQALASGGAKFRAQVWLRRAMTAAPDEAAKRMAERDFLYVRNRSRLSLRFDASIQPSNNVNNGSSSDVLWFFGLPLVLSGDARALSGTELSASATLKYRLAETEKAKTDLRFSVVQTGVVLSDKAKAQAPAAKGSDYAYTAVEFGLERSWRAAEGLEAFAAGTLGHSWYGGEPMAGYVRIDLGATKTVSPKLSFKGSLSLERQDRLDSAIRSADMATLGVGAIWRSRAKDRFELAVSLKDTASDSPEIDHEKLRLQMNWDKAKPVLGARLSLGLWAEARDYDQSRYTTDGREDTAFGAQLSVTLDKVDYMGFVPVVTLSGSKANSNVDLYDSESLGLGVSIRSKF